VVAVELALRLGARLVCCSKFELVAFCELRAHDHRECCRQPWRHRSEAKFRVQADRPFLIPKPRSEGLIRLVGVRMLRKWHGCVRWISLIVLEATERDIVRRGTGNE
jgi:hypothetical protein